MLSAHRPLDARNDDDAAVPRVAVDSFRVKPLVVKRDREDVVVELRCSIDKGKRVVADGVLRVVRGMAVKLGFQDHRRLLREQLASRGPSAQPDRSGSRLPSFSA